MKEVFERDAQGNIQVRKDHIRNAQLRQLTQRVAEAQIQAAAPTPAPLPSTAPPVVQQPVAIPAPPVQVPIAPTPVEIKPPAPMIPTPTGVGPSPVTAQEVKARVRDSLGKNLDTIIKLHAQKQGIALDPGSRPQSYETAREIASKLQPIHGVRDLGTLLAIIKSGQLLTPRQLGTAKVGKSKYDSYVELGQLDHVFMSPIPY